MHGDEVRLFTVVRCTNPLALCIRQPYTSQNDRQTDIRAVVRLVGAEHFVSAQQNDGLPVPLRDHNPPPKK